MSAFPSRDILLNPQKLKNVKQKYEKGEFKGGGGGRVFFIYLRYQFT